MKKLLFLLLFPWLAQAQSETHNFITYDTTYNVGYANLSYIFHISRPANGDTTTRAAFIFMAGDGQVGTNIASSLAFGPHYWMSNGWDGGVQLGNGKHYPIIITVQPNGPWPQTYELINMLRVILNTYHIKRNSVHLTGFSMGGMAWTAMICHQNSPGGEDGMKLITSICALEGVSNQVSAAQQAYELGNPTSWVSFGHWAKKYGGKFFGLEGTGDYRGLWQVQHPMNDSAAGSAYTQFENIGGGAHCCWNSMYDPSVTDWTSSNANIQQNTYYPGTLGTYYKGENIFTWMLRQGDTSLVGSALPPPPPPLHARINIDSSIINSPNSIVHVNTDSSTGAVASVQWLQRSGPTIAIFTPVAGSTFYISGLFPGSYTFEVVLNDSAGNVDSTFVSVAVKPIYIPPCPVCPAPRTVTGITVVFINGIATLKFTYSDGNP